MRNLSREDRDMNNEEIIKMLNEIMEMADHWYEEYCHDKCHEIYGYCEKKADELKRADI